MQMKLSSEKGSSLQKIYQSDTYVVICNFKSQKKA